jgi:hypothetical protein
LLRRDVEEHLPRLQAQARNKADSGLRRLAGPDADLLPADLPYALDDLLPDAWRFDPPRAGPWRQARSAAK